MGEIVICKLLPTMNLALSVWDINGSPLCHVFSKMDGWILDSVDIPMEHYAHGLRFSGEFAHKCRPLM
jgi:hypothetical protein